MKKITYLITCMLVVQLSKAQTKNEFVVHFAFDQAAPNAQDLHALNHQLTESIMNNKLMIDITAFCDQLGSKSYNQQLSERRADTLKKIIASWKLDFITIIKAQGRGKSRLVSNNMDPFSRQQNRRAVIIITSESKAKEKDNSSLSSSTIEDTVIKPQKHVEQPEHQSLLERIVAQDIRKGDLLILRNIHFVGGMHTFLQESYASLQELLTAMQQLPNLQIEIQGHICCEDGMIDGIDQATNTRNLSEQRAKAVYDYLVLHGIDRHRMQYKGFGHRFPLTEERNENERMLNRRVEIKILSK